MICKDSRLMQCNANSMGSKLRGKKLATLPFPTLHCVQAWQAHSVMRVVKEDKDGKQKMVMQKKSAKKELQTKERERNCLQAAGDEHPKRLGGVFSAKRLRLARSSRYIISSHQIPFENQNRIKMRRRDEERVKRHQRGSSTQAEGVGKFAPLLLLRIFHFTLQEQTQVRARTKTQKKSSAKKKRRQTRIERVA